MSYPLTYLITPGALTDQNFSLSSPHLINMIGTAIAAGVSMVQIREKRLSTRRLFELSREAAAVIRGSGTKLLINDRADIAFAAGADGVHLAADSLPVDVVRSIAPAGVLIGASTHTVDDARRRKAEGADFVVFGPVFETPGKQQKGLEALNEVCLKLEPFPVIAIGGIDESNFASALNAGVAGVAGIRGFNDPATLTAICQQL